MVIFVADYLMRDGRDAAKLQGYTYLGRGRLMGHAIFAADEIPVLAPADGHCWGEAFAVHADREDALLAELDTYHGAGFERRSVQLTVDGFTLNAEAYVGVIEHDNNPRTNWRNRRYEQTIERRRADREDSETRTVRATV